jgi:hypothetical protein
VGQTRGGAVTRAGAGDDYNTRILKMIPAETVALYLFLEGIIVSTLTGNQLRGWLVGLFATMTVLNVLYMRRVQNVTDGKQLVAIGAAFVVWVFNLAGDKLLAGTGYVPVMGSALLGLFTFVVPMFYKGVPASQAP